MKPAPVLVLDLDGTLVDTAADLIASLNVILGRHGIAPFPPEAARETVGFGARVTLQRAFEMVGQPADDDDLDRLTDEFIEHYAGRIAEASRPFPGALAALDRFAAHGWRMAVCTNKTEGLARLLLDALGLSERFHAITGGDTFAFRKPDPRHLTETIHRAGGQVDDAVMVGDSVTDIRTAQAADIPVIAVTFGYSPTPVAVYRPTRVIDHFGELWDNVASVRRLARETERQQFQLD